MFFFLKLSLRPEEARGGTGLLFPAKHREKLLAEPVSLLSDMAFYMGKTEEGNRAPVLPSITWTCPFSLGLRCSSVTGVQVN